MLVAGCSARMIHIVLHDWLSILIQTWMRTVSFNPNVKYRPGKFCFYPWRYGWGGGWGGIACLMACPVCQGFFLPQNQCTHRYHRICRNNTILLHFEGLKHRICWIRCKKISQNFCVICRIFNFFQVFLENIMKFWEKSDNYRIFVFCRKCQNITQNQLFLTQKIPGPNGTSHL